MPRFAATDQRVAYDLVSFKSNGDERKDDPHGLMSDLVLRDLASDESGITDVFLLTHGWMGDIPAARSHYDKWLAAMTACDADMALMKQARPGFKPRFVALHWPSMPWGDESFGEGGSFSVPVDGVASADPVEAMVNDYAERIADTPAARDAIRRIVVGAIDDVEPDTLPQDVFAAYRQLNYEADMGIGGVGAGPGGDRSGFDPESVYQSLREDAPSFGLFSGGGIFGVLRTLSFWRMKDRSRWFGELVGSRLLAGMMQASPRNLRFHLMGHGFGCIVMSATLAGPKGRGRVARPVESLALVQGALSIWSYCDDIPATPGQPGYFNKVIADRRGRGPILSTQSVFDTANGKWYPLGAGVAGQVAFASPGELPKYGALGTHGIRGPGTNTTDRTLLPATGDYQFVPGTAYNLECSEVIRDGAGRGGAHSDICHPQIAHAVWQAALASVRG
ncbi:hypothetical protein [Zavarzinella formosa]|uniref:hypothetical protein n=1 Tax=Zavarzinella formosa TaxID=360055 RepID=UPI0002D28EED|nr:hypothetical protein [Zavarzinella formosa]